MFAGRSRAATVAPFPGKRGKAVKSSAAALPATGSAIVSTAAAAASGLAAWAAFPPAKVPLGAPLALVAFVPLFVVSRDAGPRAAFRLGWLTGTVMTGLGFAFLVPAAVLHGDISPAAAIALYLALSLYLGLSVAIPMGIAAALRRFTPASWGAAVLLAIFEVAFPAPIPWSFGAALLDLAPLAQLASVAGAPAVSLIAFGTAAAVAELWAPGLHSGTGKTAAVWAASLVGLGLWGMGRIASLAEAQAQASHVSIAVLHFGADAPASARSPSAVLERARSVGAELVIAPETALAGVWPAEDLGELADDLGAPPGKWVLSGAIVREDGHFYNSAVLFLPDGSSSSRYDKRSLLPFAERLPGESALPWLRDLSPRSGAIAEGGERPPLEAAGATLGVSICFEDVLGAGRRAPDGAEILVNLTNDTWFSGSTEPESHLALARLRAIESGRFLARATAGGVTALIDSTGAVKKRIDPSDAGTIEAPVPRLEEETLHTRLGLLPFGVLAAAIAGAATAARAFIAVRR